MDNTIPPFLFLCDHEKKYFENINSRLENNNGEIIKNIYLSDDNVNYINQQLVNFILKKTKIKIPYQNNVTIKKTMIDIYNIHYNYLLNDIKLEVDKLNNKALEVLIKNILINIKFRNKFNKDLDDINHIYDDSQLPINVSCKGTNEINTQKRIFNLYD